MVHGHTMPFYHGKNEAQSRPYIEGQIKWYKDNVGLPTLISEVSLLDCHVLGCADMVKVSMGLGQRRQSW